MEQFDIWMLLAGIGLLLFGMETFETGIKALAGNKMKYYLEKYTKGAVKSLSMGTVVTAVLQSSSLVTLLLLGFLGAGLISLQNSIGVIIGANVGTTVSSILVSYLGFGEFKIASFALPIIALGGILILTAGKSEKRMWIGKLLVGFGLLFIGIGFMKDSVDAIKASFDLAQYKDMSLRGFGLIGAVVTLIIQSSSAMSVMTFAALGSGIIGFPASIAIVMGSNIGTTMTGVIASLGGASSKRQLAVGQVLFNVISAIIGIVFFWQLIRLTGYIINIESDPVFANAILNTIFNLFTALLFAPFLTPFTRLVRRLVPDAVKKEKSMKIDEMDPSMATELTHNVYIGAAEEDVEHLEKLSLAYLEAPFKEGFDEKMHQEEYSSLQDMAEKILLYFEELDAPVSMEKGLQNRTVEVIRSIKHVKNVTPNIVALSQSKSEDHVNLFAYLKEIMQGYISHPHDWEDYKESLQEYYAQNIGTLAKIGQKTEEENLDGASLINTVREIEAVIRL